MPPTMINPNFKTPAPHDSAPFAFASRMFFVCAIFLLPRLVCAQHPVAPSQLLLGVTPDNAGHCETSTKSSGRTTSARRSVELVFEDEHNSMRSLYVSLDSAGRAVGYVENAVYTPPSGIVEMHGVSAGISASGKVLVFRLPEKSDSGAVATRTWKPIFLDSIVQRRVLELVAVVRRRCDSSGRSAHSPSKPLNGS